MSLFHSNHGFNPLRIGPLPWVILTVFMLLPSLASPYPQQVTTLTGTCKTPSGEPVKGAMEAYFDIVGAATAEERVKLVTAEVAADGTYRIAVAQGSTVAYLRAVTPEGTHYGPRVYLHGRRKAADSLDVPIVCGELVRADVHIEDPNGSAPKGGSIYFFPKNQYSSDTYPASGAERRCYLVAEFGKQKDVAIHGLPKSGGSLRVEADGFALQVRETVLDMRKGILTANFKLARAAPLFGRAPKKKAIDPDGDTNGVVIAALVDDMASNELGDRALAYYPRSSHFLPFQVSFGDEFEEFGVCGYSPVLGAWVQGDDLNDPPRLIAALDSKEERYLEWVPIERARYELDLTSAGKAEIKRIRAAKLYGQLTITGIRWSSGDGVTIKARGKKLLIESASICPAGGSAVLTLRADGAKIVNQEVDFHPGLIKVKPSRIAPTTMVTIEVTDTEGAPVPEATVLAYDPLVESLLDPLFTFVTNKKGKASGLFLRDSRLRLVPDKARFRLAGGEADGVEVSGKSKLISLQVLQSMGNVTVQVGQIHADPCRVSLVPVDDFATVSIRTKFPMKAPEVGSWKLEAVGPEIAAAALRPDSAYTFQNVPEGKYFLAVETGFDLGANYIFADMLLACYGPHAQQIEVQQGAQQVIVIEALMPMDVELEFDLAKATKKQLKKSIKDGNEPRVVVMQYLPRGEFVDPLEGSPEIEFKWTKNGTIKGQVRKGMTYVVHVTGIGDVETAHVFKATEGAIEPLRADGAIELVLNSRSKKDCQVTVVTWVKASKGRRVGLRLPDVTLSLTPKRGKLLIPALCPFSEYQLVVEQEGMQAEVKLDSIAGDANAEQNRKTGSYTASVNVKLR